MASPARTASAIRALGSLARPFGTAAEARHGASLIAGSGTCLTRAIAVASLLPGSAVIIGVESGGGGAFRAHAWVEMNGAPIDDTPAGLARMASIAGRSHRGSWAG